jgi:hypothetical protein
MFVKNWHKRDARILTDGAYSQRMRWTACGSWVRNSFLELPTTWFVCLVRSRDLICRFKILHQFQHFACDKPTKYGSWSATVVLAAVIIASASATTISEGLEETGPCGFGIPYTHPLMNCV